MKTKRHESYTESKGYDLVGNISAYEAGELPDDEAIALFQYLLDTGTIHHLQGHYQRVAGALLNSGEIHF